MNKFLVHERHIPGKLQFAYFIGDYDRKKRFRRWFINKIVKLFTKDKVTHKGKTYRIAHVELVFPDGWSFSATDLHRDKSKNGVRFEMIDYTKHPDRWIFMDIPISVMKHNSIEALKYDCIGYEGDRYDILGVIFNFGLRFFKWDDPNKWWCSEICAKVIWDKPSKLSPGAHFRYALDLFNDYTEKSRG